MKLTKTQAIEEHRKMWNWIADETERRREPVGKYSYLKKYIYTGEGLTKYGTIKDNCFLCEYTVNQSYRNCSSCPLDWAVGENKVRYCTESESLFTKWYKAFAVDDWRTCAILAREIANLKEKQ